MSHRLQAPALLCLSLMSLSCHKEQPKATDVPYVALPNGGHPAIATIMSGHAVMMIPGASFSNVWGVFVAEKFTSSMTDTGGNLNTLDLDWEEANFTSRDSFWHVVSSVNVNSHAVPRYGYWSFLYPDSTHAWDSAGLNHWEARDAGQSILAQADVSGVFPSFTGSLPDSIPTNSAFTLSLNAADFANADSAQLYIYSDYALVFSSVVSTQNGVFAIPQQRMSYMHNWGFRYNNGIFYGGLIKLVFFNYRLLPFAGKWFAYVNEREILRRVTFY